MSDTPTRSQDSGSRNGDTRSLSRRAFLVRSGAVLGFSNLHRIPLLIAERNQQSKAGRTLKGAANAAGLLYGGAAIASDIFDDPTFATVFATQCAVLVPEVELKWKAVRPAPSQFDFTDADRMLSWALQHGLAFRGHNLVWYQALPSWFADYVNPSNARELLVGHIRTVVGRYAGRIHSWDVVNEAIEPSDGRPDRLRIEPWVRLLGPGYIDLAFYTAAQADPSAQLVYNETGLEYDTPSGNKRRTAVLELLSGMRARGVPVHALGIQGHLRADETHFNGDALSRFVTAVQEMGLKVLVTELDVRDQNVPGDVATRDRIVAEAYTQFLDAVLQVPATQTVITWGLSDRHSWLSRVGKRADGQPVRPLPLDQDFHATPAYNAMIAAFERRASIIAH